MIRFKYSVDPLNDNIYRIKCSSKLSNNMYISPYILKCHHRNLDIEDIIKCIRDHNGKLDNYNTIAFNVYEDAMLYVEVLNSYDTLNELLEE